jgi:hypothetical protein
MQLVLDQCPMLSLLNPALARINDLAQWTYPATNLALLFLLQFSDKQGNVYNILWALVFGFATLNILGLVLRRFEPGRTRLNFGEMLAILVVAVSVFLLGWEMLYVFGILPIKLQPHY